MPFNINEFKSRIDRYGGPARTSLFTVELTGPTIQENDLLFFCRNVTMPGIDIESAVYRQNGIDLPQVMPTGISREPLNCIFMLDSEHRVLSFFHNWMQRVVNYSTQGGNFASVDDQLPYEIGYKDEYACRMVIKYYSTDSNSTVSKFYEVVLDGVFPTNIPSIDLAWADNDNVATLPISFSYSRIQYSSEIRGIPSERNARGNGLLDLISNIGQIGQLINQQLVPQSVQDAINTYTRATNSFNRLRNIFR
jgi:hypothetical protein